MAVSERGKEEMGEWGFWVGEGGGGGVGRGEWEKGRVGEGEKGRVGD